MATMIIDVQGNREVHRVADALRLMKCVKRVAIQEDNFEYIPGLPYTQEEKWASIAKSEEELRMGLGISSDQIEKEIALW